MSFPQSFNDLVGSLLLLKPSQNVADAKFSLAAGWAQRGPLWLLLGLAALVAAAAIFYFRHQPNRHHRAVGVLFVIRAAVLCLVALLLAEPVLTATIHSQKQPLLWVLFDGTDSMNIADDLPPELRAATNAATGLGAHSAQDGNTVPSPGEGAPPESPSPTSRIDYLRALVRKKDKNLLEQFAKQFRLQTYLFESSQGVRSLEIGHSSATYDGKHLAEQLTANGQLTDLGGALDDLAHRNTTGTLAGLIVFSDFNRTSGPDPEKLAKQFGTKIYTVGLGATNATNASIELDAERIARTGDEVPVTVIVKQNGLNGQTAHVRLYAEQPPSAGVKGGVAAARILIGEKSVVLSAPEQAVAFVYKPDKAGDVTLAAEIDRMPGQVIEENNHKESRLAVLDDYLRLMFVEYEPTWEWRFIKEVFHRDPLVGMKGFRTFLYSSDPQVRRQGDLFLTSMTPPRDEFFRNDLIFLGDMPAGPPNPALNDRFCNMVKEFVGNFGGGLVVLCGPRFGPQNLAKTPLADLLPVTIDPTARIADQSEFMLKLTPDGAKIPFMQLGAGSSPQELQRAWDTMGPLSWYQPAQTIRQSANVLAEHPTALTSDGRKQPLIAIRQYGKGEVVYVAFNETFRLRRGRGDELYRKFWSQIMWRLAVDHAVKSDKRFDVGVASDVASKESDTFRTDRPATVSVEPYDEQYHALSENDLPDHRLTGEWQSPGSTTTEAVTHPLTLTQVRPGHFAAQFVPTAPGKYRIRVMNPISHAWSEEVNIKVISTPVERQTPNRNTQVQDAIASESGGRSYDIKDVDSLLEQIQAAPRTETTLEVISLVNTWTCFGLIAGLLIVEWLLRKRIGLA